MASTRPADKGAWLSPNPPEVEDEEEEEEEEEEEDDQKTCLQATGSVGHQRSSKLPVS